MAVKCSDASLWHSIAADCGYTANMSQQAATTAGSPTVFFSYARADISIVRRFAEQLRSAGIQVLLDIEFLRPGERFENAILDNVRSADALVFFVSPSSVQSKWVEAELLAFSKESRKAIFPVLISGATYSDLPAGLAAYQALLVENDSAIDGAARQIARALVPDPSKSKAFSQEAERRAAGLAASIAADIRAPTPDSAGVTNSVFLVHGHDIKFRDEVDQHLRSLGIQAIILSKETGGSRSLLDRFEALATKANFAVVLMSPDDLGASRLQYEYKGGGEHTLKYRARENVILELGFFYGRLGWDHVFIVKKSAENPWPDFERPSDLAGAVIFETSSEVGWRDELAEKLREAKILVSD